MKASPCLSFPIQNENESVPYINWEHLLYDDTALLLASLSGLSDESQPAHTEHCNMSHCSGESSLWWTPSHACMWLLHCCCKLLSPRGTADNRIFFVEWKRWRSWKRGDATLEQLGQQFKHLLWQPKAHIHWQLLRKELAGFGSKLQSLFRGPSSCWTADSDRRCVINFISSSAPYKWPEATRDSHG